MKNSIKNGIDKKDLTFLHLSDESAKSELTWLKDDEFIYKGQTYDVVNITREKNGNTQYSVITDRQEKLLFDNLTDMVNTNLNKGNGKKSSEQLLKFFGFKYLPAHMPQEPQLSFTQIHYLPGVQSSYQPPYLGIQSPPPDLY